LGRKIPVGTGAQREDEEEDELAAEAATVIGGPTEVEGQG
jgi:hypothetical protein